jgi:hypothetical protein
MTIPNDIWSTARKTFLPLRGVIGVGWGPKLREGRVVAHQSIIVLVEMKLPLSSLTPEQVIPPTFRGVPTDVRVPRLTPQAEAGPPPGSDTCLTDHAWIDWGKVHRRRAGQDRGRGEP